MNNCIYYFQMVHLIIKIYLWNSVILLWDKVMLISLIIFISIIFFTKVREEDCYTL